MYKYGIVVIGYKNINGICRLLSALNQAKYINYKVDLIISIDYSDNNDLIDISQKFKWMHGDKYIIEHKSKLGLRKHVLQCGDYLNTFDLDALIVFEDDMYPSVDFFEYVRCATEFYIEDPNIAGISLYNREINQTVMNRFYPVITEFDTYFLQYAQSRGQVWFKNQWNEFKKWYELNIFSHSFNEKLPIDVQKWPETSWLKYHIQYCVENNKYFVYPYISFSTCFGDAGTHLTVDTNMWQVYLSHNHDSAYKMAPFSDTALKYDVFFENQCMYKTLEISEDELETDLYGGKNNVDKKYFLTSRKLNCKVIKSWGNYLVPHELNIIRNIPGNDFFLYEVDNKQLLSVEKRKTKEQSYLIYVNKWIDLKLENKRVSDYLKSKNINSICIYGYNIFAKMLYEELYGSSIEVKCIIDKNESLTIGHLDNCYSKNWPKVDAYIIASFWYIEEIIIDLKKRHIENYISMKTILDDLYAYGEC